MGAGFLRYSIPVSFPCGNINSRLTCGPFAAMSLNLMLDGVLMERSLVSRSVNPWMRVLPPVTITEPYNDGLRSMSHMPEELKQKIQNFVHQEPTTKLGRFIKQSFTIGIQLPSNAAHFKCCPTKVGFSDLPGIIFQFFNGSLNSGHLC